jgi:hypothetical protein
MVEVRPRGQAGQARVSQELPQLPDGGVGLVVEVHLKRVGHPHTMPEVLTDLLTRPTGTGETARDTSDAHRGFRLVSKTRRNAGDRGDVRRSAHNPATAEDSGLLRSALDTCVDVVGQAISQTLSSHASWDTVSIENPFDPFIEARRLVASTAKLDQIPPEQQIVGWKRIDQSWRGPVKHLTATLDREQQFAKNLKFKHGVTLNRDLPAGPVCLQEGGYANAEGDERRNEGEPAR